MSKYSLTHVSDAALARDLAAAVAHDRASTANLLAHIAEFDARQLYLPAAYPSMHSYCVHELGLSEDAAFKRIQAARAALRFPALFPAVADGRLHLAAVCLLAPHLAPGNAEELIAGAARKPKAQIERMLAERFPRSELMPLVADSVAVVLRTEGDPTLVMGEVRKAVAGIDSRDVIYNVKTMNDVVSDSFAARRLAGGGVRPRGWRRNASVPVNHAPAGH